MLLVINTVVGGEVGVVNNKHCSRGRGGCC